MSLPSFNFFHSTRRVIRGWGALEEINTLISESNASRVALVIDAFFADHEVGLEARDLIAGASGREPALYPVPSHEPDRNDIERARIALDTVGPRHRDRPGRRFGDGHGEARPHAARQPRRSQRFCRPRRHAQDTPPPESSDLRSDNGRDRERSLRDRHRGGQRCRRVPPDRPLHLRTHLPPGSPACTADRRLNAAYLQATASLHSTSTLAGLEALCRGARDGS